jgi:acyl-CoA thioesterase-2
MTICTDNFQVSRWDGISVDSLLELRRVDEWHWHSVRFEQNANDRIFGGQLLGQALLSAAQDIDPDRQATAVQFMFLYGAETSTPIQFKVKPLQNGKRFTSRHVRGTQGVRPVCDAQVSFAVFSQSPTHEAPATVVADPESSLPSTEVPTSWTSKISESIGHTMDGKLGVDIRFPHPPYELLLDLPEPRLRFWMRLKEPLPDDPHLRAAALHTCRTTGSTMPPSEDMYANWVLRNGCICPA